MWEHQDWSPGQGLRVLDSPLPRGHTGGHEVSQGSSPTKATARKGKAKHRNGPWRARLSPPAHWSLTGICTIGHDQHPEGGKVDVSLISVGDEGPVHVPGLHASHLCCGKSGGKGVNEHTAGHRRLGMGGSGSRALRGPWRRTFVLADFLNPGQRVHLH